MSFSEKVVLISGASSGIGADAAVHLAKLGASVAIVGRNENRLYEVAEQIVKNGSPKPLPIVADVTKDAERIINDTIKHFGRLDVLVNSAGIFNTDEVNNLDIENLYHILSVNLKSVIILTTLAVPHLEKTKGNIVNVSSIAGLRPYNKFISYSISKAALDQYTKCIAIGLAPKGIRVNSINPALIRTPIIEFIGVPKEGINEFCDKHASDHLVGRVGEVTDTSSAIAYLASAPFINGHLLPVDGGMMCSGVAGRELI